MELKEQIDLLEKKFENIDSKIEQLIKTKEQSKQLLTENDFIVHLDLSVYEMELLEDFNDIKELDEKDIKRLMRLNELLHKKYKWINRINKSIMFKHSNDYKVVNKNSIALLKAFDKEDNDRANVIINCYIDDRHPPITLETLGVEDEKGNNKDK